MKKNRSVNTFSLAFLDIMLCGFGSVVLLVMLIQGKSFQKREETHKFLLAEIEYITELKEMENLDISILRKEIESLAVEEEQLREKEALFEKEKARLSQEKKRLEENISSAQKKVFQEERLTEKKVKNLEQEELLKKKWMYLEQEKLRVQEKIREQERELQERESKLSEHKNLLAQKTILIEEKRLAEKKLEKQKKQLEQNRNIQEQERELLQQTKRLEIEKHIEQEKLREQEEILQRKKISGEENVVDQDTLRDQEKEIQNKILAEVDKNRKIGNDIATQTRKIKATQDAISSMKKIINQKQTVKTSYSFDRSLVGFDGDGQRQYLTGLKLGGERTLILVDTSASMLDETIVNIILYKIKSAAMRRQSPKWLRTVRSLHWLVANLKPDKKYQVFHFNSKASPAIKGAGYSWLSTSDSKSLNAVMNSIRQIAPKGGTNLNAAFDIISQFNPKPDSVILLTDGLPTQGKRKPKKGTVSGAERLKLFQDAARFLPAGVPINTLLFPIEGDPNAAAAYWGLAIETNGSFLTPSRDWP